MTEFLTQEKKDLVSRIFAFYCSYGEPLNNSALGSSKFVRFLKDCNLIREGVLQNHNIIKGQNSAMLPQGQNMRTLTLQISPKAGLGNFAAPTNISSAEESQQIQIKIKQLTLVEADLIFKRLTGLEKPKGHKLISFGIGGTQTSRNEMGNTGIENNKKKQQWRIEYQQFVRALAMVGLHVFCLQKNVKGSGAYALNLITDTFLTELDQKIQQSAHGLQLNAQEQITQLLEVLRDEQIVQVLSVVHTTLLPFYSYYANEKSQLDFQGFSKFCVDFGIFPDILSKPKIFRFFKNLANFYLETKLPSQGHNSVNSTATRGMMSPESSKRRPETTGNSPKDLIDDHLFIEALALSAFEVVYRDPQPSNVQKIILLVERMNHSGGPKKIQMAYGITRYTSAARMTNDLTSLLRKAYPQFFLPAGYSGDNDLEEDSIFGYGPGMNNQADVYSQNQYATQGGEIQQQYYAEEGDQENTEINNVHQYDLNQNNPNNYQFGKQIYAGTNAENQEIREITRQQKALQ